MSARPFVIITTRLPPASCGIGAYSLQLRKHWPIETPAHFVVIDGAAEPEGLIASDTITEFNGDADRLSRVLRQVGVADVLLHYAGRAYHRLGCPRWLPRVLKEWKQHYPSGRLLIFFHELPGPMPITSRHFWLGLISKRIIRQLVRLADALATNTDGHAAQLRELSGRDHIPVFPVASNIEPVAADLVGERTETEFVLFGLPFGRLQAIERFSNQIVRWIETGRMTRLHIIGPRDDQFTPKADALFASWGHPTVVTSHGALPAAEVAQLLSRARFALTNVTAETWSKSGAFMAGAASRCAIVLHELPPQKVPLSYTLAASEVEKISPLEIDARTEALAEWYHENAHWPVIARKLAQLLPADVR